MLAFYLLYFCNSHPGHFFKERVEAREEREGEKEEDKGERDISNGCLPMQVTRMEPISHVHVLDGEVNPRPFHLRASTLTSE